ncbi:MAG: hypothetical protein LBK00_07905 [Treponema sp.]|nr:hypothetical protein [Treponema sp.]
MAFAEKPDSAMNQIAALLGYAPVRWLAVKGPTFFVLTHMERYYPEDMGATQAAHNP